MVLDTLSPDGMTYSGLLVVSWLGTVSAVHHGRFDHRSAPKYRDGIGTMTPS